MTEPIKLGPTDQGYLAIFQAWLQGDKPAIVHMTNGSQWMKLDSDSTIFFIKLDTDDNSLWNATSLGGIVR